MMLQNDLCLPQVSIPYLSPHPQLGVAQDVCNKGSWRKQGESIGGEGTISTTVSGSLLHHIRGSPAKKMKKRFVLKSPS